MKSFLSGKVIVEPLPSGGADSDERRLANAKGEMAQIVNRAAGGFRHLVYWDLDSPKSGQTRGNHYHLRKTEQYYVISGQLELSVRENGSPLAEVVVVSAGDRVTVRPLVVHSFKSRAYAQVLEFSPDQYDPDDTRRPES